jgi:hypothetical protein
MFPMVGVETNTTSNLVMMMMMIWDGVTANNLSSQD